MKNQLLLVLVLLINSLVSSFVDIFYCSTAIHPNIHVSHPPKTWPFVLKMRMTEKRSPSGYQLYESYNAQQVPFYPLNQTIVLSLTAVEHNTTTTTNTNNNTTTTTTAILKLDQNGHVWKSIETSRRKGRTTTSKNNMTFAFYHFQSKTNDTTPITFRIQTDAWIQRLHQLATFEKIHGHCHVANTKRSLVVESNASLNRWIIEQRQKKRNGQLSMERQLLLESIPSFDWEPKDTAWMFLYQTYKAYSLEYTTTNTTTTIPYAQFHPRLASWISTQRHLMKHGKLSKQRQDLLMQLGFQFTSVNKWRNQFLKLQQFQQTHGHCLVPQEEDPVLGQWVNRQRRSLTKLSNEQRSLLESIGFQWSIYPTWDEMYNQLKIYKETNGHCSVPTSSTSSTNSSTCTSLGRWVYNQRQAYKQNHLSKERKQLLDDLGLDWDPSNTTWTNFYNALKQYQAIHNTSYISYKDTTADPSLRLWVVTQRQLYQKQLLSSERKQRLNEIGFEFSLKKKTWLEHYHTLCSFSSNSSSSNSSTRSMLPPHLSQWLKRQRYLYTKGCLSEPRQQLLNTLIETEPWWIQQWNVSKPTKSRTWMEHYTALTKFQQDHWHCRVPLTSSLGKWVQTQRKELLTMEQQRMLNELGFQWSFPNSDGTH